MNQEPVDVRGILILCLLRKECAPPVSAGRRVVEPHIKFWKGWGLTGTQFLGGVAGNKGVTSQASCNFLTKNKLKSGMFNDKKVYKAECFALL